MNSSYGNLAKQRPKTFSVFDYFLNRAEEIELEWRDRCTRRVDLTAAGADQMEEA